VVFKRRDRRPIWKILADGLWPKGGWLRAAQYVRHRMHRLPGSPEMIARGIFAGVFTAFTPFYGLHFLFAGLLAWIMRGNIVAALLATFFGNPLTYVPIGFISLKTGYLLLGLEHQDDEVKRGLMGKFVDAGSDLKDNIWAWLTGAPHDWSRLVTFYDEVFFPYMVGGLIPGIVAGTIAYYLSVPVIRVYKRRRADKLAKRLARAGAGKSDQKKRQTG